MNFSDYSDREVTPFILLFKRNAILKAMTLPSKIIAFIVQ